MQSAYLTSSAALTLPKPSIPFPSSIPCPLLSYLHKHQQGVTMSLHPGRLSSFLLADARRPVFWMQRAARVSLLSDAFPAFLAASEECL